MSLSHQVPKLTVRIECELHNGVSVGTGFWFGFQLGDEIIVPFIVTNKHVVDGAHSVHIQLNVTSKSNHHLKFFDIQPHKDHFIPHPDEDVDLCILPVLNLLNDLREQDIEVENYFLLDSNFLGEKQISAVEDVFMTGYPNGLWDHVNNRPVTRKGITASSPLEEWQGKRVFMIDMACYGGSSGSPVFIMNEGSFMEGDSFVVGGGRLIFLGVLYAGPTIDAQGSLDIVDIPTANSAVITTKLMMNLGLVINAERLNDFKPILGL